MSRPSREEKKLSDMRKGHRSREVSGRGYGPAGESDKPLPRVKSQGHKGRGQRFGKKRSISRLADSGLSLPWTRFSVSSTARSPRIVPGAASLGLVTPITVRTTLYVSSGP